MTSTPVDNRSHIDDGDLLRLLDAECSETEAEQIQQHINDCPECRENAESLRMASELFSNSAIAVDEIVPIRNAKQPKFDVGRRRRTLHVPFLQSRMLRIAAVLAVAVLVFSATPARALVARGWQALRSLVVTVPEAPVVELSEPVVEAPEMSSLIRFTPSGSGFRLEFVNRPASGTLILVLDSATSASAGAIGGDGADEMILLPSGLRVRNSTSSTSSYEVRLPLSLTTVEVTVAGLMRLELTPESTPIRREVDLSGEGGS